MVNSEQAAFFNWINTFDPELLENEDDVETKFVLPFFNLLGYTDQYRKGKYPIDDYNSDKGKKGRKPEIDQIYFSVVNKHGPENSLIIVEAKKPQEADLEKAIKQARYYGNHLLPVFLVVTNGHQLIILKRHGYRSEEVIFNIKVHEMHNHAIAKAVYDQLCIQFVKQIKEQGTDTLIHALYADLMDISNRYPDLQTQLAKGDFQPDIMREKRQLTIIKPTVAIKCDLPIAFEEGSCTVEFSNIMLRGLTCYMPHTNILKDLFIGVGTPPHWGTRRFLVKENTNFKALLGNVTIILSEREAKDLCEAIDVICDEYKILMLEATNILETWDYIPIVVDDIKGFHLFSVECWLWKLMHDFANEFDYGKGTSELHIFDSRPSFFRVTQKESHEDHAIIFPHVKVPYFPGSLPNDDVDILYVDPITYLKLYDDIERESLYEDVGSQGVWTARYTKDWLLSFFIPHVILYYSGERSPLNTDNVDILNLMPERVLNIYKEQRSEILKDEQISTLMEYSIEDFYKHEKEFPLHIGNPKQLQSYIDEIQALYYGYYVENIPTFLLRQYYKTFAELVKYVDPTTLMRIEYICENLRAMWHRQKVARNYNITSYKEIIKFIDEQVIEIYDKDYENRWNVDLISRVFCVMLADGEFRVPQNKLNEARKAIKDLWEYCRFEKRFIEPVILGY